jgi:hypothetical protein
MFRGKDVWLWPLEECRGCLFDRRANGEVYGVIRLGTDYPE